MLSALKNNNQTNMTYPYNVLNFETLDLSAPVVFLTGDNGTGKSTILNVIANLSESIILNKMDDTHLKHYDLSLVWSKRLKRGYYFQSEDFYSFLSWAQEEKEVHEEFLEYTEQRHHNKESLGYILESNLHKSNAASMDGIMNTYMKASHGEGVIRFFQERLRSDTLYLMDEPETPLSFQNQLVLLNLIHDSVKQGSQFIICTHSPVLLAYPNACIYHIDNEISKVSYEKHPLYKEYQSFFSDPMRYMHYLFQEG